MANLPDTFNRRALLKALALIPFAGASASAVRAEHTAARLRLISSNVCMVQPQASEGPFYLDPDMVRSDIREDREGVPVGLAIQVVTANCDFVPDARVDLWHCDAAGEYAGFTQLGDRYAGDEGSATFLRGTQFTDNTGVAKFTTIYPGFYPGRTPHFHYKVFLNDRTVLTSQFFLPEDINNLVFENFPPYAGLYRNVFNRNDGIARRMGEGAIAAVKQRGDGFHASIVVGIEA